MEMPNSLGNLHGDIKNTEGVPKSLGDLIRGCQILRGAGSPMTPDQINHSPRLPALILMMMLYYKTSARLRRTSIGQETIIGIQLSRPPVILFVSAWSCRETMNSATLVQVVCSGWALTLVSEV